MLVDALGIGQLQRNLGVSIAFIDGRFRVYDFRNVLFGTSSR
jgi:hypothetical protein